MAIKLHFYVRLFLLILIVCNSADIKCDIMKKPSWLIIEKPQFNRFERFKFSLSKYCYLFPTGCAESKSMAEFCYHSFDENNKQVDKADFYLVTYGYQFFFLWFRLQIRFKHDNWTKNQLYQKYNPTDKSKTTFDDFINQMS